MRSHYSSRMEVLISICSIFASWIFDTVVWYLIHMFFSENLHLLLHQVHYRTPPDMDEDKIAAIRKGAAKAFKELGLRDYARFDGWVLTKGKPEPGDRYKKLPTPRPLPPDDVDAVDEDMLSPGKCDSRCLWSQRFPMKGCGRLRNAGSVTARCSTTIRCHSRCSSSSLFLFWNVGFQPVSQAWLMCLFPRGRGKPVSHHV